VSQKIDGVTTHIDAVPSAIVDTVGTVADRLADVSAKLELIHTDVLAMTGRDRPNPTQAAFDCIRVLNQVEDLITDRHFALKNNNRSLSERSIEAPTLDCVQKRQADPDLQNRFKAVYLPIADDRFLTLADRYADLDQLRRDIVRHFQPLAPTPSTAEAAEKRRSKK